MDQRFQFGCVVVVVSAGLQSFAWYLGFNGQVFAFTSLIIGLTAGSLLGFSFNISKKVEKFINSGDQGKSNP